MFECKVQLTRDIEGVPLKTRQSYRIRRWYQRHVDKYQKTKSGLEPEKWYKLSIDLDEMINDHEFRCHESSGFEYETDVNFDRLIKDFDGGIVVVRGCDWHWAGILSLWPWEELGRDEDGIVQDILRYHVFRDENKNLFFDFNEQSPLNEWFLKRWRCDDVPCNLSTILCRVRDRLKHMLENDDHDRYHEWIQGGECTKCDTIMFDKKGLCPECGRELKYGE